MLLLLLLLLLLVALVSILLLLLSSSSLLLFDENLNLCTEKLANLFLDVKKYTPDVVSCRGQCSCIFCLSRNELAERLAQCESERKMEGRNQQLQRNLNSTLGRLTREERTSVQNLSKIQRAFVAQQRSKSRRQQLNDTSHVTCKKQQSSNSRPTSFFRSQTSVELNNNHELKHDVYPAENTLDKLSLTTLEKAKFGLSQTKMDAIKLPASTVKSPSNTQDTIRLPSKTFDAFLPSFFESGLKYTNNLTFCDGPYKNVEKQNESLNDPSKPNQSQNSAAICQDHNKLPKRCQQNACLSDDCSRKKIHTNAEEKFRPIPFCMKSKTTTFPGIRDGKFYESNKLK